MLNCYQLLVAIGGSRYTSMPPPDYSRLGGGDIVRIFLGLALVIMVTWCVLSITTKRRYKK